MVETALRLVPDRTAPLRVLDLGTGSGCLLVALLHELPAATGIGADRALGALLTARANAWRNRVGARAAFVVSDWALALAGPFDLIVSNPPYIPAAAIAGLDAEVRDHDPRLALDGGRDGLDAYGPILHQARRLLGPDGLLVLEIGYDQAEALPRLAGPWALKFWSLRPIYQDIRDALPSSSGDRIMRRLDLGSTLKREMILRQMGRRSLKGPG